MFQILNNLVENKFQVRLNRNRPLILVLLKEARMKPWVNDLTPTLEEYCLYCCPSNNISSFLLNEEENMSEFNKSLFFSTYIQFKTI